MILSLVTKRVFNALEIIGESKIAKVAKVAKSTEVIEIIDAWRKRK